LTAEEIRTKSEKAITGIRAAISARPPDLINAKIMALELRQLNRLSNYRNRRFKDDVMVVQKEADSMYLSFHKTSNHIWHLRKKIAECLNYPWVYKGWNFTRFLFPDPMMPR
jgi:hypothetical protein